MKNLINIANIIGGILLISMVFTGCIKDEVENNSEDIFEFLWTEMDENYGGFIPRKINWDSLYTVYAPQAVYATEEELWVTCTSMIDVLDDQHVNLTDEKNDRGFSSGKEFDEAIVDETEFDLSTIKNNYMESGFQIFETNGEDLVAGLLKGSNIAYVHFPNFYDNGLAWEEVLDQLIVDFKDTDGFIVDVRNNGGGSPLVSHRMANRFAATRELAFYAQTKNGPAHDDFDEATNYYMEPAGDQQYTKPVVALCNHSTVSAGEEFFIYLQTQEHITVLGDSTSNAFSDVSFRKFMPNGYRLSLPSQLYSYPDGTSPEGIGIVPDVYLRNDTTVLNNGIDQILEEAMEMIF